MICDCCGARIDIKLDCLERKADQNEREMKHIHAMLHEILQHVVTDPAKLAEITDRITAKSAAIKAAIDANPIPAP